ncbi:MAG: ATP-binding protein [Pseudomonadota bacterium]
MNDSSKNKQDFTEEPESLKWRIRGLDRRQVEEALRESEVRYHFLFEEAQDGIALAEAETGEIVDCNQALCRMTERDKTELLGQPQSILHPQHQLKNGHSPSFLLHKAEDPGKALEDNLLSKSGKMIPVEIRASRVRMNGRDYLLGIFRDITERKQVEKGLVETIQQLKETRDALILFEKEAVVGRLAVGVAHELLNPVSIISSRLQFLEEGNLSEQAREDMRICREQLQRITRISQDLNQSAAKQPGILVGGDLRHAIEVGLQMTERRIKEDHLQVEYDPPSEVIPVKMERDRLVKVMVNLIFNACDAMTGNMAKRLIITVHRPEDSSKDDSIFLTVADNGRGIPAGNLNRIFEPFFTTKDPGKGTGLGLSVCKGIIQEHGGTIRAENNDIGGASFIAELPLSELQ